MNQEHAMRSIFAGLDDAYAAQAIARMPENALASHSVFSAQFGTFFSDTQVPFVPIPQVTENPISFLKRYYSGLMVEMGYLHPDRRFVWQ